MNEFNGRLTDSGQVVTDQIIPFSKIKGRWIQNSKTAGDRLIVKTGDEQVVRIGRVQSSIVATKESLLRLAKQCLSVEEQPFDELTMDAMSLVDKFENHLIPEGGKEQYEGRIRLVDYILEKKPVTESGCRYCPHCLKETPTVFAICLACWTALESHGLKPYRIIEEEDEEVTTKQQLDEEIRRNKETIFKDVVHEAQEGASQDNDYGFDPSEVDYDEEGDEEMDEAEDDEEVVADDEEEEEAGEAEAAPGVAKMPKWALNLDVGSIRLPAMGMINTDSSEGAAQLFDNAVLAKVMGMYRHYYRQRVLMTPEDYRAEMTTGRVGRLDLDGICPYTGEDDDGSLRRPTEEELDVMFRAKAKEEEWMQGEMMYGGARGICWWLWSRHWRSMRSSWSDWCSLDSNLRISNFLFQWTRWRAPPKKRMRWEPKWAASYVDCWKVLSRTQHNTPTFERVIMGSRIALKSLHFRSTYPTGNKNAIWSCW